MKAWEKHLADLYLLGQDIRENLFLQPHGYKSRFFYTFNPQLNFELCDGTHMSQIKLLELLVAKDAASFELKQPTPKTPRGLLSKNTRKYSGEAILLRVQPEVLSKLVKDLERYRPKTAVSLSANFNDTTGDLVVGHFIVHFQPNSNGCYLLRLILKTRRSRKDDWAHSEIEPHLDKTSSLKDIDNFVRNTANNINKRIVGKTDGQIKEFLVVTTKSVHLNEQFV